MKRTFVLLMTVVAFTSCEKLLMPKKPATSPQDIFESVWKAVDEGYVYLNHLEPDWDSVYREFRPKIFDTMTERQLFDTCALMLSRLEDPSVKLISGFGESHYTDTVTHMDNFNFHLLTKYYLKNYEKSGPFIHKIIDSIGYVYYESFEEEIKEEHLNSIIEKLRFNDSISGVVFDIRDNRGGNINNVFTLLKRMGVDTTYPITTIAYKYIYKQGKERDNFTEPETAYIEQSDKTKFPKRFVLLTNRGTKGEAALFAAGAKGYANVRIYGDTTGGGAGRVVASELPNGWRIQYTASIFTTNDDRDIEDGVPPHKRVDMSAADEVKGKDSILEAALEYIRNP